MAGNFVRRCKDAYSGEVTRWKVFFLIEHDDTASALTQGCPCFQGFDEAAWDARVDPHARGAVPPGVFVAYLTGVQDRVAERRAAQEAWRLLSAFGRKRARKRARKRRQARERRARRRRQAGQAAAAGDGTAEAEAAHKPDSAADVLTYETLAAAMRKNLTLVRVMRASACLQPLLAGADVVDASWSALDADDRGCATREE